MRTILTILLTLVCLTVSAQSNRITATITVTNSPTTNGMALTVNGGTARFFTNVVVNSALTIQTNATIGGSTTNLFNQILANPYSGPVISAMPATNVVTLVGPIGSTLTATTSGGNWASVSYSTQVVTRVIDVRVPLAAEAAATNRTNIASLLAQGISDYSTTAVARTAIALSNFGGLLSTQTWAGYNTFNNSNLFTGINSFTNSTWNKGALLGVTLTVSNNLFVQTNLGIHQTAVRMGDTNIDWSLGNVFIKTNLSNSTLTFSSQTEKEITVLITNTTFSVTWPSIVWQNGVTPVQTTNKTDMYFVIKAGAQYLGRQITNFGTGAF